MDKIRELAKQFTVSDPADIDVYRNELERNEGIIRDALEPLLDLSEDVCNFRGDNLRDELASELQCWRKD